jgi:alpha-galactosidase
MSLYLRREADEHEPELRLTATVYEGRPFAMLQAEVANRGASALRVQSFRVIDAGRLDLGSPAGDWRIYKEGWQNWSPALVLPVSGEDLPMSPPVVGPATRPPERPGRFLSEMMTAIAGPGSGASLVTGFTTAADQFSQVWLDRDEAALTAASYADGVGLAPGGRLASERLLIEPGAGPQAAMRRYGDALATDSGAVPWPTPVAGWCSWYCYWQGVSEEAVLANLDYISEHRRELPFEYVQVDDGYQAGIGDWLTPNDKFPHGMGWVADRIHERGLKAGLWLARS